MKLIIKFSFLLLAIRTTAQPTNFVMNPGFEDLKPGKTYPSCAYGTGPLAFTNALQHWGTFIDCTPDLVVWLPSATGDCHFPKPHSGDKAVGIITYMPALDMSRTMDFHEFIQGKLSRPLEKGNEYTFAFYIQQGKAAGERHVRNLNSSVKTLEVIPLAAGSLGVWFTDFEEKTMSLDVVFPQLVWYDPIVTQPGERLLMSKTFKADRAYTHFTVGNFTTDSNTATDLPNSAEIDEYNSINKSWQMKKRRVGYYLFDDFSLTEGSAPPVENIAEALKSKSIYTFKNVNFNSGKWDLLTASIPELESLLDYLKNNPGIKVEIGGHTDNMGNDETNRTLSEKRAEAVVNYLNSNGIAKERVSAKGYGETKPTALNDTENGRLLNRRVECKIK